MAINKSISSKGQTHASLKNVIAYVLQDEKVKDGYVAVTGPYDSSEITATAVYDAFIAEKRLWGKDTGRMYIHSTLSFHKDEAVTPEKALEIGERLATEDSFYRRFQTLVAVHQDKDHVHVHFVSNSVSFLDGYKHQHGKADIEALMQRTDELCREYGLTIAEKGKHFDGTQMKEGDITSSRTKDYRLQSNSKKSSWKAAMMVSIMDAAKTSTNREEFVSLLREKGIDCNWSDSRKYITFTDTASGNKCRNSTLASTYHVYWLQDKEALDEFIRTSRSEDSFTEEFEYTDTDGGDWEIVDVNGSQVGFAGINATATANGIVNATAAATRVGAQATSKMLRKSNQEQQKKQRKGVHL